MKKTFGNYPAGAEHDPHAPWNEREPGPDLKHIQACRDHVRELEDMLLAEEVCDYIVKDCRRLYQKLDRLLCRYESPEDDHREGWEG